MADARKFGDLTPEEQRAATREAAQRLQAELNHPAMVQALSEPLPITEYYWTLAVRHKHSRYFSRITDWSGTWQEAYEMAQRLWIVLGEKTSMEVFYVPTAEYDRTHPSEDSYSVLVNSGKRIPIKERGKLPSECLNDDDPRFAKVCKFDDGVVL